MNKVLLTGFGPFGNVEVNPSWTVAQAMGLPCRELEVSFQAVDEFLVELAKDPPQVLISFGVAARSRVIRLERQGRNEVGPYPDVLGDRREGKIDPKGPGLSTRIWSGLRPVPSKWRHSRDAGNYLCNYILYRSLQLLPQTAVGFIHIPLFERMPKQVQIATIKPILHQVLSNFQ